MAADWSNAMLAVYDFEDLSELGSDRSGHENHLTAQMVPTTYDSEPPQGAHAVSVDPFALLVVQVLVLTYPDIIWSTPVWLELHHVSIVLGAAACCISVVFGFATYGAFVTHHRRRGAVAAASLALMCVVVGIHWHVTVPIWPDLGERMSGDVVLQSAGSSCAAASAANLARQYGVVRTEREMAVLLETTKVRYDASTGRQRLGAYRLLLSESLPR